MQISSGFILEVNFKFETQIAVYLESSLSWLRRHRGFHIHDIASCSRDEEATNKSFREISFTCKLLTHRGHSA